MEKSIVFTLLGVLLSVNSFARPCTYNRAGQIDWQFKCEVHGESEQGYSCDYWIKQNHALVSQVIVREECYDGNAENQEDQKRFLKSCQQLGARLAQSTVVISPCDLDGRGNEIQRRILNVTWNLSRLESVTTLKDGSEQGKYKSLFKGRSK